MPVKMVDGSDIRKLSEAFAEWESTGGVTIEECGCWVEVDGTCQCGNESPLLSAGLI